MNAASSILDRLGSSQEIADFINAENAEKSKRENDRLTDRAVRAWKLPSRQIPGKHWPVLMRMAEAKDIALTYEELERASEGEAAA